MEPFEITTREGEKFEVTPINNAGKMSYKVTIDGYTIIYSPNPNPGGPILVPESTPIFISLTRLDDIGEAIEQYTF